MEIRTTSIGFSKELVNFFIFFGAEDSDKVDAFLFFTTACSAALVFLASDAEGRIGLGVGAGGAEEIGAISSGTTNAVALEGLVSSGVVADASTSLDCSSSTTVEDLAVLVVSSDATLVVALAVSSAAGMQSSALVLAFSSAA